VTPARETVNRFLSWNRRSRLLLYSHRKVAALSTYSRARVSLDQVLGETLEKNNVSVDEALKGRVARESAIPDLEHR
jgi:hypothetical protein